MKLSYFLIALLASMPLKAEVVDEDLRILFGGWSNHSLGSVGLDEPFNETHNLVGIQYGNWSVGYFRNSYDVPSILGYYSYMGDLGFLPSWVDVGIKAGFMGGYEGKGELADNLAGFVPYVALSADVDVYEGFGFSLSVAPYVLEETQDPEIMGELFWGVLTMTNLFYKF